jgi:hypothetical protein
MARRVEATALESVTDVRHAVVYDFNVLHSELCRDVQRAHIFSSNVGDDSSKGNERASAVPRSTACPSK